MLVNGFWNCKSSLNIGFINYKIAFVEFTTYHISKYFEVILAISFDMMLISVWDF